MSETSAPQLCPKCRGFGWALDPEKEKHADHRHYACPMCLGTGMLPAPQKENSEKTKE